MTGDEITIQVLKQIRDEVRATREEVKATREGLSSRIDETNARLDLTNARVAVVESTMLEMAEQQRFIVRHLRADRDRAGRIDHELADTRSRLDAVEDRLDAADL